MYIQCIVYAQPVSEFDDYQRQTEYWEMSHIGAYGRLHIEGCEAHQLTDCEAQLIHL